MDAKEISTLFFLLQMLSGCHGQYYGLSLGPLADVDINSGISGNVYVVDDTHFAIEDFSYNGLAPDLFFWVERKNNIVGLSDGMIIPNELGLYESLSLYDRKTILLELPSGVHVSDLTRLSLWCRQEDLHLAHVHIPEDVAAPGPQFVGEFPRVRRDIQSSAIVIEDDRTIRFDNFYYDGDAPDARFTVGNGTRVGTGFYMRLPDENGSLAPLGRYDGETIRIHLTEGTSIVGQKYIAVYCEDRDVDFVYISIPCDLNVPPNPAVFSAQPEQQRIAITREVQTTNPCSIENQATDPQGCLSAIRQRALDQTAFMFPRTGTVEADFSQSSYVPRSLVEQIFGVADQDLSSIDRILHLRVTSPAGSYTGCDHTFSNPNERSFWANPLSNVPHLSWDLRVHPNTTWDHNEGEFFTSVFFDPTRMVPLALQINLVGDSYPTGVALLEYTPPSNPSIHPRPYVRIIYKQTRRVPIQRFPTFGFNVTNFAERNGLEGPVGITWFDSVADASSAEGSWGQNCAGLVEEAMRPIIPNWPFVDSDQFELSVFLRVRFTSPAFNYTCGPFTVTHPPVDIYLDPIAHNPIDTALLRTESQMTFSMEMSHLDPRPADFFGRTYTIMITNHTQFIRGLFVNVDAVDPNNSGTPMLPYSAPQQFGSSNSEHLVFLLYEQTGRINPNGDLGRYSPGPCLQANRCFNDIGEFVSDNGLQLVGMVPWNVSFGEYSQCTAQTV